MFRHCDEVVWQSLSAGHRDVLSYATFQIHVQKLFLGPQMRALLHN
jgi:hypothetical protein